MKNTYPSWVEEMNQFHQEKTPFIALISFDKKLGEVWRESDCAAQNILFDFNGHKNFVELSTNNLPPQVTFSPPNLEEYENQFRRVMHHIKRGDTYLINLCNAAISRNELNLNSIFHAAQAKYRLCYKDEFIVFSPESFINWSGDQLTTFPMKGTIDANHPNAHQTLMNDEKERAEHYTIVDLLRNDIGMVCDEVQVNRFAYIEELQTSKGPILQMSSKISGRVAASYLNLPGNLFYQLLPAGSISGAPKNKTLEVINEVESSTRGFYTGIMIYFNGYSYDSGVMIRFIEKTKNNKYVYRSGGGITFRSELIKEYDELNRKVYLPIF